MLLYCQEVKQMKKKICEVCGSEFTPKHPAQKTDSPKCKRIARLKSLGNFVDSQLKEIQKG